MSSPDDTTITEPEQPLKSFRRKFRKIKYHFDEAMQDSERLFRQEDKAKSTMKRLTQQNDQLAEVLLGLNEDPHIPEMKKFNLELQAHEFTDSDLSPSPPLSPSNHGHNYRVFESQPTFAQLEAETPHTRRYTTSSETSSSSASLRGEENNPSKPPADLDSYIEDFVTGPNGMNQPDLEYDVEAPSLLPFLIPPESGTMSKSEFDAAGVQERFEAWQSTNPHSAQNWLRRYTPTESKEEKEDRDPPAKSTAVKREKDTAAGEDDGDYRPKGGGGRKRVRHDR